MRLYTDGACSQGSTQNGGWGVAIFKEEKLVQILAGNKKETTNNEMELTAFLNALKYAAKTNEPHINIATDSAYIYNAFDQDWIGSWKSRGWKRPKNKELAHVEMWKEIDQLVQEIREKSLLTLQKVKGHSTNAGNNLADKIATEERDKLNRGV